MLLIYVAVNVLTYILLIIYSMLVYLIVILFLADSHGHFVTLHLDSGQEEEGRKRIRTV